MILLMASPWHLLGSVWYLGMLPVIIGLLSSRSLGFLATVVTPVAITVSLLSSQAPPWAGACYIALLGAVTGLSAMRGWHGMMTFVTPLAAYALIGDIAVPDGRQVVSAASSTHTAAIVAAVIFGAGLWTVYFGSHVFQQIPVSGMDRVSRRTAKYYSLSLGTLCGLAALVSLEWLNTDSWWMILTLCVVVQPYFLQAFQRARQRVVGTLTGAFAAAVLVELLQGVPWAFGGLALLFTAGAVWANLTRPYWIFVSLLTLAVLLQTTGSSHDIFAAIFDRVIFTVAGAAVAVSVMAVGHRWLTRSQMD